MTRPNAALDLLKAAAARNLRARWYVVDATTGVIIECATLCRPRALRPEHVVVGVR